MQTQMSGIASSLSPYFELRQRWTLRIGCRIEGPQRRSGLHFLREFLLKLFDLRRNYYLAIGLLRVIGEVFLMVVLRHVELFRRFQGGDDRSVPELFAIEARDCLFRSAPLFFRVV